MVREGEEIMELLKGIQTRRSIRAFQGRPVDQSILERVLLAASNAPSYSNTQPWEIAVVTGKTREKLIRHLYRAAQSKMRARPHFPFPGPWPEEMRKRSSLHMRRRFEAAGIQENDREGMRNQFLQNFLFFNAPVVVIFYINERLGNWSIFDMGLFVQNVVLSAHALGLATCIQAMPVAYPEIIAKCLALSSSRKILVALALGYENKKARINQYRSEKKPHREWLHWRGF
jgi:nitroreductase